MRRRRRKPVQKPAEYIFPTHRRMCQQRYKELTECQRDWIRKEKSQCHKTIKTLIINNQERILKMAKKKGQVIYKGKYIRITPDISVKTLKYKKAWTYGLQTLREHGCQPRVL